MDSSFIGSPNYQCPECHKVTAVRGVCEGGWYSRRCLCGAKLRIRVEMRRLITHMVAVQEVELGD